jgi:hypothetical protein
MKTRSLAVVLLFLISSVLIFAPRSGYSQRASGNNNDIALDFVDFLVNNTFAIQYEFKSTSTTSFLIRGEYVTKGEGSAGTTSAFGVGGAWRFYILDSRALSGFSIAPAIDLFFFKNTLLSRNNVVFSLGADGAYKFFFGNFTVEPTVGLREGIVPGSNQPPGENTFTGIYPVVSLYLGWAW